MNKKEKEIVELLKHKDYKLSKYIIIFISFTALSGFMLGLSLVIGAMKDNKGTLLMVVALGVTLVNQIRYICEYIESEVNRCMICEKIRIFDILFTKRES